MEADLTRAQGPDHSHTHWHAQAHSQFHGHGHTQRQACAHVQPHAHPALASGMAYDAHSHTQAGADLQGLAWQGTGWHAGVRDHDTMVEHGHDSVRDSTMLEHGHGHDGVRDSTMLEHGHGHDGVRDHGTMQEHGHGHDGIVLLLPRYYFIFWWCSLPRGA